MIQKRNVPSQHGLHYALDISNTTRKIYVKSPRPYTNIFKCRHTTELQIKCPRSTSCVIHSGILAGSREQPMLINRVLSSSSGYHSNHLCHHHVCCHGYDDQSSSCHRRSSGCHGGHDYPARCLGRFWSDLHRTWTEDEIVTRVQIYM